MARRRKNPTGRIATLHMRDVDTGRPVEIEIEEVAWRDDEIRIKFGSSYRIMLRKSEAIRLADRLHELASRGD